MHMTKTSITGKALGKSAVQIVVNVSLGMITLIPKKDANKAKVYSASDILKVGLACVGVRGSVSSGANAGFVLFCLCWCPGSVSSGAGGLSCFTCVGVRGSVSSGGRGGGCLVLFFDFYFD